ncbi:hypothetical protein BWI17_07495 [Betaproteobacteria bacterium GR16-43]|nr:hypothetical protein BWI17_07495 [Betaproteobacteria bacterium GR16-43]
MTNDEKHTCPRDQSTLEWHDRRGFGCHQCGQCSGLFIKQATFTGVLGQSLGKSQSLSTLPKGDVACAFCSEPMLRLIHKGVEIDICRFCRAFWLDGGEWERIAKPGAPAGSKGSAGRRAALLAGAAAGGVALGAVAAEGGAMERVQQVQQAVQADGGGFLGEIVGSVASEAGDVVIQVVFEFIGEAIGSLF